MNTTENLISTLELRRLLHDLKDNCPEVCIRFRLLGEMWAVGFMRIMRVTDRGAIFSDGSTNKFIHVPDLNDVMQFEIDSRFQHYQPHFHYEVKPMVES